MEKREDYFKKEEYKARTSWHIYKERNFRKATPEEKKAFNISTIPIVCRIEGKTLLTVASASDIVQCFKKNNIVILLYMNDGQGYLVAEKFDLNTPEQFLQSIDSLEFSANDIKQIFKKETEQDFEMFNDMPYQFWIDIIQGYFK
jgi:hypothetical protein